MFLAHGITVGGRGVSLRRYIDALGGQLRIEVDLGDERIQIALRHNYGRAPQSAETAGGVPHQLRFTPVRAECRTGSQQNCEHVFVAS